MMRLAIETYWLRERFGDEKAVEMIKTAGFDCYDYSFHYAKGEKDMLGEDYRERAEALRKKSNALGISCNQAHAPFDMSVNDAFDLSSPVYLRLVRSLEAASILGAENIVVHAIKKNLPEDVDFYELNRRFYLSLLPYCEKFHICVSVENLFRREEKMLPVLSDPREHHDFVKSLDSPYFNICIDVGHSFLTGYKPEQVIAALDEGMLKTLHIHDNDGVCDKHFLPYMESLDWSKIMKALAGISYRGDLTFELHGWLKCLPDVLLQDGLALAEKVGRHLIAQFATAQ